MGEGRPDVSKSLRRSICWRGQGFLRGQKRKEAVGFFQNFLDNSQTSAWGGLLHLSVMKGPSQKVRESTGPCLRVRGWPMPRFPPKKRRVCRGQSQAPLSRLFVVRYSPPDHRDLAGSNGIGLSGFRSPGVAVSGPRGPCAVFCHPVCIIQ